MHLGATRVLWAARPTMWARKSLTKGQSDVERTSGFSRAAIRAAGFCKQIGIRANSALVTPVTRFFASHPVKKARLRKPLIVACVAEFG